MSSLTQGLKMEPGAKVAILGLDGVPFHLIHRFIEDGVTPCLKRIADSGRLLKMRTSLPPVSSVAWTSFMTGANPGRHGIFGFTDLQPGRMALSLPSFDNITVPTIWGHRSDLTSVVVNLPFTYPARPINGALIAGFVAPLFERAVYPESLLPWLKAKNYRIDVDASAGRNDRRGLVAELFDTLVRREEVILELMAQVSWDLFIGVITGTDRLHHFFFDAAEDPAHPFHPDFIDYYRRVDMFVEKFVERLPMGAKLILLSDHGFTNLKTQVYLNELLERMGYLTYQTPNPTTVEHIDSKSVAFAMDPTRIYLNCRDRFESGRLSADERQGVALKLQSELKSVRLSDAGIACSASEDRPDDFLFSSVLLKDEIYHGDSLPVAPDLVVIPKKGFDVKATIGVGSISMNDIFTGTHTHDDAFLLVDRPELAPEVSSPSIEDVAEIVLGALPLRNVLY